MRGTAREARTNSLVTFCRDLLVSHNWCVHEYQHLLTNTGCSRGDLPGTWMIGTDGERERELGNSVLSARFDSEKWIRKYLFFFFFFFCNVEKNYRNVILSFTIQIRLSFRHLLHYEKRLQTKPKTINVPSTITPQMTYQNILRGWGSDKINIYDRRSYYSKLKTSFWKLTVLDWLVVMI